MYRLLKCRGILFLSFLAIGVLTYVYYSAGSKSGKSTVLPEDSLFFSFDDGNEEEPKSFRFSPVSSPRTCPRLDSADTSVDTIRQFPKFDFQPYWMKTREYWDRKFENRYKERLKEWAKLPLKVIVIPHSHNDPGWLRTFEAYYHYQTRNILNNMADKLNSFSNMTFIWSEMSFFSQWWQSAHPTKRRVVQKLINEGRLEMVTGGWVMTDEATSHVFAMVDQLIHGHQWIKTKLGVTPNSGWSVDPFGHGPTVPYLLKASGFKMGTVIQRIHYAWKQWLADAEMGDFHWRQSWDKAGRNDFLVHNQPFDIYSIKHSCGPHPQVCLNFDFRKIAGEYTEFSLKAVFIDSSNVKQKSELLLEQYGRTGSLFPHNVVLMPLGDDFRYDHELEWDQQYKNYQKLFNYINENKNIYNAEVHFGTPSDYFKAVKERMKDFKTLKGDFFVYSDIFSEGHPAYWSGYFTTRPYWKLLDRELEAELRSAEILYTMALNTVRRNGYNSTYRILERDFEKLQRSRQNLALFQHHDAITGTSKAFVMEDYAEKLFAGIQDSVSVQSYAIQALLMKPESSASFGTRFILPDVDRQNFEKIPEKIPLSIVSKPRKIVVFNSLAQTRHEAIKVLVTNPNVLVKDADGIVLTHQINPVWNLSQVLALSLLGQGAVAAQLTMHDEIFELLFLAKLEGLTVTTFTVEKSEDSKDAKAVVYCKSCSKSKHFEVKAPQQGDIQLENHKFKVLINGGTGFLQSVMDKETGKFTQCGIQFAAYPSAQFHSGAYLFKPDPNAGEAEREVLEDYPGQRILISSGPVSSEVTVVYGRFLTHSLRLYRSEGPLGDGIYLENIVDFESPPKNRETELFMRFTSDIVNGEHPEFYSDQNGFQTQKRVKVARIGIEGNYFPITTHAYIEDKEKRLTVLVNHAQGAASWQPGWLEVMLDRRTLYDDSRGMGEGVVDNKRTLSKYWLLLEPLTEIGSGYSRPSLLANYLSLGLLYPPNTYVFESAPAGEEGSVPMSPPTRKRVSFLTRDFPCDVHLMNLRTLHDGELDHFPSKSALMVIHKQGYACSMKTSLSDCIPSEGLTLFREGTRFVALDTELASTTLTGLHHLAKHRDFEEIKGHPMELMSINVTFS